MGTRKKSQPKFRPSSKKFILFTNWRLNEREPSHTTRKSVISLNLNIYHKRKKNHNNIKNNLLHTGYDQDFDQF